MRPINVPQVRYRTVDIDDIQIFYREAGAPGAPTMLLLHGFPSSSHQFQRLIDSLGNDFHLIAPDYPGFGHSDAPASDGFTYSFESLSHVIERFCERLGLSRFVIYAFDYGAPVGFRMAIRRPEWLAGLIVQNANAYEEGLSGAARELVALRPETPGARDIVGKLLTLDVTRQQYIGGVSNPEAISPDGWLYDQHFLDLPERQRIQIDLHLDYHSNVALYPTWQAWLRVHQPPLLIVWGRNDPFFTERGARAYLRDLPDAELHLFDTGHFALEENLPEMAPVIAEFVKRAWKAGTHAPDTRSRTR